MRQDVGKGAFEEAAVRILSHAVSGSRKALDDGAGSSPGAVRRFRCPLGHFWAFFGVGSPHLDLRVHRAVLNQEWGVGRAVPVLDWQLLTFSLL